MFRSCSSSWDRRADRTCRRGGGADAEAFWEVSLSDPASCPSIHTRSV